MASLVALLNALPAPIDAGWILFVVWAAIQVAWYRRAHVEAPAVQPQPPAPRHTSPRRPAARVVAPPIEAAGPPLDTISLPDVAPPSGTSAIVLGLG